MLKNKRWLTQSVTQSVSDKVTYWAVRWQLKIVKMLVRSCFLKGQGLLGGSLMSKNKRWLTESVTQSVSDKVTYWAVGWQLKTKVGAGCMFLKHEHTPRNIWRFGDSLFEWMQNWNTAFVTKHVLPTWRSSKSEDIRGESALDFSSSPSCGKIYVSVSDYNPNGFISQNGFVQ